jgi:LCP family protein required for cell wall assembly
VPNPAGKGELDKLTHCGIYGIKNSMRTLSSLYKEDIAYYVRINFSGFKKLIDALGGVTVYSDYAFTAITRTPIAEGENHLNGQQALDFARERYTLPGGDNERGKHQMQVITAVIEKATSGTTIITNYSDIMASVEGMFTMNVPMELVSDLMKMQLSDMARWNIVSYAVVGGDAMEECYSARGMKLAVLIPYESSVSKASRLIDMVYSGEILTEEVINSME